MIDVSWTPTKKNLGYLRYWGKVLKLYKKELMKMPHTLVGTPVSVISKLLGCRITNAEHSDCKQHAVLELGVLLS